MPSCKSYPDRARAEIRKGLPHGPFAGIPFLVKELVLHAKEVRCDHERVGDDFRLMLDCWMSLDLDCAIRLARAVSKYQLKWIEEALSPDDYWGYAALREAAPQEMLATTGEHAATRWGFRMLLEMGCCDIIQPEVGWCGGLTELLRISHLADQHQARVVPHASGVYSYHFVITRHDSSLAEFLMTGEGRPGRADARSRAAR